MTPSWLGVTPLGSLVVARANSLACEQASWQAKLELPNLLFPQTARCHLFAAQFCLRRKKKLLDKGRLGDITGGFASV